ncbi:MAG TPA: isoprenylcysteine carboxylmethyltransferase family protein [Gemmataceae bacterium]|nr:isoprenylcysteine carboxylmethyltransferase family protein [Gemmataceae bacterium]
MTALLLVMLSLVAFLAIEVWAYGDTRRFFQQPARLGMVVATVLLALLALFSRSSGLSSGEREDRGNRWVVPTLLVLSLLLAWLPPYMDGRDLWTLHPPIIPYLGLILYVLGGVLRIMPVFALGRRFSGLVAIQHGHRLKTDGLYRFIRHPSYTGLLVSCTGLVLIFRCGIGLFLVVGIFAILLARIKSEEALLASTFGEEYEAYRRRTWRLVPWVY